MKTFGYFPVFAALISVQAQVPPAPMVPAPAASPVPPQAPPKGSVKVINYMNMKSTAKVELTGTRVAPEASCVAKVKCKEGVAHIFAKARDLPPAASLGGGALTYVLWGISPEGRAINLGELVAKNGKATIEATQGIQAFGLLVTAEPYFAVTRPSQVVVLESTAGKGLKGQGDIVVASYDQASRPPEGVTASGAPPMAGDEKTPLDVRQARNAVSIARASGASVQAGEAFGKAEALLGQAEGSKASEKERILAARQTVQLAEDARSAAVQRIDSQRLAIQGQEARRLAREKKLAEDQVEAARMEAARAAASTSVAQAETNDLRSRLMEQLNAVLQTRESARGLIVNLSGVLFKTGQATLAPAAREKLAKIAGILATHKGLKIEADGYTDSTGSEVFNQHLSERRAMVTREFLVSQGVSGDAITFKGFGEDNPIAPNETDEGRKVNRRVELVVTGPGLPEPKAP
jgi:outer membrane protein OmpA-like peptidoglycan-associated protein